MDEWHGMFRSLACVLALGGALFFLLSDDVPIHGALGADAAAAAVSADVTDSPSADGSGDAGGDARYRAGANGAAAATPDRLR
eukprot:gene54962-5162_t